MPHFRITIESAKPYRPTERKQELALRVCTETQDDAALIAARMLTAWCADNMGTLGTYCISGLSTHDMGEVY